MGDRYGFVWGTVSVLVTYLFISSSFLFAIAIAGASLASTSFMLLSIFSYVLFFVAMAIIGVFLFIRAKGPCFSSPPGNPSACLYDISFSFRAPSRSTGSGVFQSY